MLWPHSGLLTQQITRFQIIKQDEAIALLSPDPVPQPAKPRDLTREHRQFPAEGSPHRRRLTLRAVAGDEA